MSDAERPRGRVGTEHPVNARSSRSGRLLLAASALERAGKRLPAVLRLLARARAIPGAARLALNRLPTRCSRHLYLDRALGYTKHFPPVCCVGNVFDATWLNGVDTK